MYPHVPLVPPLPVPGHWNGKVTGGHPLMSNTGLHTRPRRSLVPYLVAVLLPLAVVLVVLLALGLWGQPSTSAGTVPSGLQVVVSPSACTFPDGS
jgi:hypothetical protein